MGAQVKQVGLWLGAILVGCCINACQSELETITWEPVDYQGILDDFANPTGPLIEDSFPKTLEAIEEATGIKFGEAEGYIKTLNIIYQQVDPILDSLGESEGGDPEVVTTGESGELDGINVFARRSCVGPDPENPDFEFNNGEIRFESSSFSFDEAVEEGISDQIVGHVFTQWEDCRFGDFFVVGEGPGYISDAEDQIVLDLALTVSMIDGSSREINNQLLTAIDSISILVETEPGVFYVLAIAPGAETDFIFGTADGFLVCTVGTSGFECATIE